DRGERGQHDQRDRDAVPAKVVAGVDAGNPAQVLLQLEATGTDLVLRQHHQAQREGDDGERQRQPARHVRTRVARQQHEDRPEARKPDQDAEDGPGGHAKSLMMDRQSPSAKRFPTSARKFIATPKTTARPAAESNPRSSRTRSDRENRSATGGTRASCAPPPRPNRRSSPHPAPRDRRPSRTRGPASRRRARKGCSKSRPPSTCG